MNESEFQSQVLRRLDVLIGLLLERPQSDVVALSSRAQRLKDLGLGTGEIAAILGKPSNQISAALLNNQKKKRKTDAG